MSSSILSVNPVGDIRTDIVYDGALPAVLAELDQVLAAAASCVLFRSGTVVLRLTDDATIADLNRRFRGVDSATDVLTFPAAEIPGVSGRDVPLGDIVISVETAALQARMRNVAMQDEMAHLIIHGLLHLAGYDDEEEAGRAEMIAAQNALVAQIGFTPEPNWCSLYGVVQP